MKKLLFILAAVFVLAAPLSVFGGDFLTEDEIAALEANDDEMPYSVLINNTGFINFTSQQPINVEGRVYVPVRGVFESLGYEVDYDPETKAATLTSSLHSIELIIGNEYFTVDGKYVYPDTPQFILKGSYMIPLRAVAEAIGAEVGYNQAQRLITINYEIPAADKADITTTRVTAAPAEETTEATTEAAEGAETAETESVNLYFTIDGTDFRFLQTKTPNPINKMSSPYGFKWYVYSPNLTKFYMLGINDEGEIVAFYAQSVDFAFKGLKYGMTNMGSVPQIDGYTVKAYVRDTNNKFYDGKLYALFVCNNDYMQNLNYSDNVIKDVKSQLFTMLSAIRAAEGNGAAPLERSEYTSAQDYTDEQAENGGQTKVSLEQRLINTEVYYYMPKYELFEASTDSECYFDLFDKMLSDIDAYQALIYGGYYEIDLGLSQSESGDTLYYAQNIYISKDDYYSDDYEYR